MKGAIRNPMTVWLLSLVTCGMYAYYFIYMANTELKNYLGKEDLNPVVEVVIGMLCAPFAMWRLGTTIHEAQQRAGMANAENQATMLAIFSLICGLGYRNAQAELNKVWESGGGTPAAF